MRFFYILLLAVCCSLALGIFNSFNVLQFTDPFGNNISMATGATEDNTLISGAESIKDTGGTYFDTPDNQEDASEEGYGSGTTKSAGIWEKIDAIAYGLPNFVGSVIPADMVSAVIDTTKCYGSHCKPTVAYWIVKGLRILIQISIGAIIISLILRFNANDI